MRSGFHQIEQNSREFFLDVHAVARNFAGEQDWQWLKGSNAYGIHEGQVQNQTRWEKFTDEMTAGTQFYSNDSKIEDRIALGVCTALYCLPYVTGRMVYDGLLNSYEYGAWRTTGRAYSPLHPEGRKTNGYVLGAAVSVPFVAAMAGIETTIRAVGFSERAKHEVTLAWNSAGYLLKRWTRVNYNPEADFKTHLGEITKTPTSWMDGVNCIGLLSGGLLVSGAILSVGVLAAGTALLAEGLYKSGRYLGKQTYQGGLFAGESLGRALGISERSSKEINLAWHSAGFLLKRWTGKDYSTHPFKATFQQAFKRPTSWMEGMDCIGLATGGLLVSGVILTLGTLAAGTALLAEGLYKSARYLGKKTYQASLFLGESLGRALGISERSGKEINLAWHSAGFLLKRWTGKDYSAHDFRTPFRQLFNCPTNWMEGMDCIGLATGGLLVSGVILTLGTLAAGTALLAEGLYKSARYLGKKTYQASLFLGESLGRALGISERSGKEMNLAWHSAGFLLKRWTGKDYSTHPFKASLQETLKKPTTWMEGMDCIGLATGGLLISGTILAVGALAAGTALLAEGFVKGLLYLGKKAYQSSLFLGESLGRALGISERSGKEIHLAWHSAGFLLKRWTGKDYSTHPFKATFQQAFKRPTSWMEGMDCIGLATGGLLISGTILAVGVLASGTALLVEGLYKGAKFLDEALARSLGVSERSGKLVNLAWHSAGFFLTRWTGENYSAHDFKTPFRQLFNRPTNWREGLDCIGLATGGLLVSTVLLTAGVLTAGTALIGEGLLKTAKFAGLSLVRALGFSKRSGKEINLAWHSAGFLLKRWTGKDYSAHDFRTPFRRLFNRPTNWMEGMDCIGLATGGLLVSGVILTLGTLAAGTALLAEGLYKSARYIGEKTYQAGLFLGESLGRALGISERSGKEINLAWHSAGFLLKRWTGKDYSTHPFKATFQQAFKRPSNWMEGMDCIGLATGGLLVSGVILTLGTLAAGTALLAEGLYKSARYLGKKTYQGSLFLGESLGRALGISERSGKEINLAWHSAGFLLKRWTGKDYSAQDFRTAFRQIVKRPTTWMEGMDCIGLATGGLLISGAILTVGALAAGTALIGEGLYKTAKFVGESLVRLLGISERSKAAISVIFAKGGNLFGLSDPANLPNQIQRVKAPVRSWMDVCDSIGTVVTATLSSLIVAASVPLALVGFSKSNYHRFCFHKHHINNLIDDRRKKPVNKALETYHRNALAECESTFAGNLLSKLNIFNITGQTTFAVARLVVAPTIYAVARLLKGIIPATIRAIGQAIYPKNLANLDDPIVRVRKRFADLNKALNLSGKLPQCMEGQNDELDINAAVLNANRRNQSFFKRAGFTLFSEARRIVALGHTPEEKVLAEFEDKFEQFVNARRRAECRGEVPVPVQQFFKNDVGLPNGKRFSYEYMLNHIKGSFTSAEDQLAIERIANLLQKDIQREMDQPGMMP
jgi:hypothetical protein